MKKSSLGVVGSVLLLCWSSPLAVLAGAPGYLPVQGVLRDASGNLISGEVEVVFGLYDRESGGNLLWSESQRLDVDGGLFIAYLGFGSSGPLDLSMFASNGDLYLEIQVGDDNLGRVYLGSAPFSAYAEYCGNIPPGVLPEGTPLGPQSCQASEKVVGIDSAGLLQCQPDLTGGGNTDPSAASYDSGWTSYPAATKIQLDLEQTFGPDHFVFGMIRTFGPESGMTVTPAMGAVAETYATAYSELRDSRAGLNRGTGNRYMLAMDNTGNTHNLSPSEGEIRLTLFERPAEFDSGWQPCGINSTYTEPHGLGVIPDLVLLELTESENGSGWRVPMMAACNFEGRWVQTSLISMSTSEAVIRTGDYLASFVDVDGRSMLPTEGFYRLRLFRWTPDYQSEWLPISTGAGDQVKKLKHDLGQIPSLVMLYVSAGSNCSQGWCLPALGNYLFAYDRGTAIYSLDERWVTVKAGNTYIAGFEDRNGTEIWPTEGYIKFMAWK